MRIHPSKSASFLALEMTKWLEVDFDSEIEIEKTGRRSLLRLRDFVWRSSLILSKVAAKASREDVK